MLLICFIVKNFVSAHYNIHIFASTKNKEICDSLRFDAKNEKKLEKRKL